jgi:hypothetical protein
MIAYGTKKIVQHHGLRLVPNGSIFEQPGFLLNTAFWNVHIIFGDISNTFASYEVSKGVKYKTRVRGQWSPQSFFSRTESFGVNLVVTTCRLVFSWVPFPPSQRYAQHIQYIKVKPPPKNLLHRKQRKHTQKFVGILRRRCVKRKYVSPWVRRAEGYRAEPQPVLRYVSAFNLSPDSGSLFGNADPDPGSLIVR